jgi:hypothetical protein
MKSILICPLSELENAQDPIRAQASPAHRSVVDRFVG